MKKYLLLIAACAVSLSTCFAQSKLDLPAAQFVSMSKQAEIQSRSGKSAIEMDSVGDDVTVIVTFTSAEAAQAYVDTASNVLDSIYDMVIVNLTADELLMLAEEPTVKSISRGYESRPLLDVARAATGVEEIQKGTGLIHSYTGKGVIAGLMDVGLDPNHANFLKDGVTRFGKLWVITGSNATPREYSGTATIGAYKTDDETQTHGTHVLGIMAGSYNQRATEVALINDRTGDFQLSKTRPVPYYGVATDAEIAACAGSFQGNNILMAAQCVRNYARSVGKPAVMNLSLGHNFGPHDGTTASCRYLSQVGKEMIICISAGNEGAENVSYHKDFTASDRTVRTFVSTTATANGIFDLWSYDASKPSVTFAIVDKSTGDIKYSYKLDPEETESVYITGNGYTAAGYIHDPIFNSTFGERSYIILSSNVSADNGRYNMMASLSLNGGSSSGYAPAFIVDGVSGQSVDMYCTTETGMVSNNRASYVQGNPSQSINDLACGDNVIVVGAYVNRSAFPSTGGIMYYTGNVKDNAIADFSSYGKTFDGRTLPDITGPGMGMISSFSNYYVNYDSKAVISGRLGDPTKDKHVSYWGEMSGTSMSAPFVSGVCALWLEADPTLTVDEIKSIMKETADNDEFTAVMPERWGYGKINALAGIKKILGSTGIAGVISEGSDIIISDVAGGCEVFAAGAAGVAVQLYTVGGALAASINADGDTAVLSTDGLAKGIYVLRASADGSRTATRKIVL